MQKWGGLNIKDTPEIVSSNPNDLPCILLKRYAIQQHIAHLQR